MNPVNNNGAAQLLQQMQAMAEQAGGAQEAQGNPQEGPQFAEALRNAVETVNETQLQASAMQDAFVSGDDVELTEVMVSLQKSQVAFEATKQVRNQLVEAYQDIYNMPV